MLVRRHPTVDRRGSFTRLFCAESLAVCGFDTPALQINHSITSRQGSVRGLHYQEPPHCEIKYVTVLHGEIFDVAVDLRRDSPTFLKWHAEVLSAKNQRGLLIPRGFAHGFQCLSNDCELIYMHSHPYVPEAARALNVHDPMIDIQWPLQVTEISDQDAAHPFLTAKYTGVSP